MIKAAAVFALLALSACTDPSLSADMVIGPGGVSVNPVLSGTLGNGRLSIQP